MGIGKNQNWFGAKSLKRGYRKAIQDQQDFKKETKYVRLTDATKRNMVFKCRQGHVVKRRGIHKGDLTEVHFWCKTCGRLEANQVTGERK